MYRHAEILYMLWLSLDYHALHACTAHVGIFMTCMHGHYKFKQNGERHYLVVIIVANCSDGHFNLPQ